MRPSTLARVLGLLPALAWASNSTSSIVIPNTRDSFLNSTRGAGTFTGEAWIDIGHVDDETWIGHVTFTPSARSYWHRHERGSCSTSWPAPAGLLTAMESPTPANGDTAMVSPGIVHWHGADAGSYMVHLAVAHGATQWLEEVSREEYERAIRQVSPCKTA